MRKGTKTKNEIKMDKLLRKLKKTKSNAKIIAGNEKRRN